MKLLNIAVTFLIFFTMWSCSNDGDKIVAELIPYKRVSMYDVNSSDPNVKYISQYFVNYDRVLITDVDSSDYWFNFSSSYKGYLLIAPPSEDNISKGIQMLDELLIKWYNPDFIKKHFPYSLILSDTITTFKNGNYTNPSNVNIYVGSYFIASKVQDINLMNDSEKSKLANELHTNLWSYINDYNPFLKIAPVFYSFGQPYYDKSVYNFHPEAAEWFDNPNWATNGDRTFYNKLYSAGFIKPKILEYTKDAQGNINGIKKVVFLSQKQDQLSWILYLLNTPDDEVQAFVNSNPALKTKYDCLVKAFTDAGIDYRQMGYKPNS